jgi:hypothetical protein
MVEFWAVVVTRSGLAAANVLPIMHFVAPDFCTEKHQCFQPGDFRSPRGWFSGSAKLSELEVWHLGVVDLPLRWGIERLVELEIRSSAFAALLLNDLADRQLVFEFGPYSKNDRFKIIVFRASSGE